MESVVAVGSYTSMSKGEAMAGKPDGCGKSVLPLQREKTIRIAESSDMDSWNELLGLMCKFYKVLSFGKKMNRRMFYATIPERVV